MEVAFFSVSFLSDEVAIVNCVIKCIMVHLQRITLRNVNIGLPLCTELGVHWTVHVVECGVSSEHCHSLVHRICHIKCTPIHSSDSHNKGRYT